MLAMKLLLSKLYAYGVVAFIAVLMCVGLVGAVASHDSVIRSEKAGSSCESMCLSHTQTNTVQNILDQEEDEDKEPTPLLNLFDSTSISLGLYGVSYAMIVFLIYQNKRYLAIQQLRF